MAEENYFHRHQNLLTGLLLAVLAWLIYLPSAQYGFVYYDDVRILKDHPELYGQSHLTSDLEAIFETGFPREEPLLVRDVTWALDSRLFGFGNPLGYHLGNVLLNGIVVALLFAFLIGTTRRYGFAVATAAAYLLLAVHVEPVAWIMGRKDILCALFMLLALCAQTQRLTATRRSVKCAWYAATILFFVAAVLSKISALTFPLVLLLHAVFLPWLQDERSPDAPFLWRRPLWRETLLAIPALAVSGIVYVWYLGIITQASIYDSGHTTHGLTYLWNWLMVDPLAFWLYLRQIFLPAHLAILYSWPALQAAYAPIHIVASLATLAAVIGTGLWLFYRRKDLFFYYAVFFALMLPYLNLFFAGGFWVADRYLYFSSFCVLAIAISLTSAIWRHAQRTVRLVIVGVVVSLGACNVLQLISYQPVWRTGETLWQNHLLLPHPSPRAYDNLAAYYYAQFSEAVVRQDQPQMVANLHKMTLTVEAGLADFWRDRQQPPPPETYFLFFLQSLIQEVRGEPDAALASLLISDQLHPRFDSTNLNLSRLYHKLAGNSQNLQQRETYLLAARDRFATYLKLVYHGQPPPPEARAEMAGLETECAALRLSTNPAPKNVP
jgi:hypothetical protein